MKLSKVEPWEKAGDGLGTGKLLQDIETISNALYLDKALSKDSVPKLNGRSKFVGKSDFDEARLKPKETNDVLLPKEKKSIWSWKGLMGFTRNRRFNCCFSLEVHSIEDLPSCFDDLELYVHWKRRDSGLVTRPARVSEGVAEFEDQLTLACSVYGSRSGPHQSAKYEAKNFLLYAAVHDSPKLDLGKHRVDLTRFLPLALEELEDEKSGSKWTTSFRLSGVAKGARMNVTFGYSVVPKRDISHVSILKRNNLVTDQSYEIKGVIHQTSNLPTRSSSASSSVEDIKDLHEVLPMSSLVLAKSAGIPYHEPEEDKLDLKVDSKFELDLTSDARAPKSDFDLVSRDDDSDKGIEKNEHCDEEVKSEEDSETETSNVSKINRALNMPLEEDAKCGGTNDEMAVIDIIKEDLHDVSIAEIGVNSPRVNSEKSEEEYFETKSDFKMKRRAKSLSLDDITNSVADEFLDMLGIEHSPFGLSSESESESPRERLLRQFEKDTLAAGCSLFDFDTEEEPREKLECGHLNEDQSGLFETEINIATETDSSKPTALMHEWGLNENAFVASPPGQSRSPIDVSPGDSPQVPPLGEGVGPFVRTKNGGFLQSMNPTHFRNAKSGCSLVMQISSPIVVPAEMGSGVMEILEHLASFGIEKLSVQAKKIMPLDDVTGKTMQQMAWEAVPGFVASKRQVALKHTHEVEHNLGSGQKGIKSSEFRNEIDLLDLAPLAMDKIEALSIEGLRIQSGMSDEEAPSNITPQTFGEISSLEGKRVDLGRSLGLEGVAGLRLLDIKESGDDDMDGLMSLSLTLNEWLRLDSGEFDEEDGFTDRTSKILAAYRASDSIRKRSKTEKKRGKSFGAKKCGLLGSNFTVALLVQLRDPISDFEPVGTPILALIQVEGVLVPPKLKFYITVSDLRNKTEDDEDHETKSAKKEDFIDVPKEEERVTQFKITEVHVVGLRTEPRKKKIWGSTGQQQSGSRWLIANGMGKGKKTAAVKTKATGDTLWSISASVHGNGAKWNELAKLNPHI